MSHNEKSFNKKITKVQTYLLLVLIHGGYICRSPDTTGLEKAKMRRRLSLAQFGALGENRENSNPGSRSRPCRRHVGSAYPSPTATGWTSGRSQASVLQGGQ